MAVYLLNCMHQIQSTLALYEYMDQRLERLQVIEAFLYTNFFIYIIVILNNCKIIFFRLNLMHK